MRYAVRKLVNLIYPPRCIFCRDTVKDGGDLICPQCLTRYGADRGAVDLPRGMGRCRYALVYRDAVRSAILRYKFRGRVQYAGTLAHFMLPLAEDADLVTWVPIHFLRQAKRTYDQSRMLASALSKQSGIPLSRTLRKVRHTRAQSTLPGKERAENVRGAFRAARKTDLRGKRILLVDDVVTTGSTMAECARTLYASGAAEVKCIALAHGGKPDK